MWLRGPIPLTVCASSAQGVRQGTPHANAVSTPTQQATGTVLGDGVGVAQFGGNTQGHARQSAARFTTETASVTIVPAWLR